MAGQILNKPSDFPLFQSSHVKGRSQIIDTSKSVWQIGEVKNRSLNFDLIKLQNPFLLDMLRYTFAEWIKSMAPDTAVGYFGKVKKFLNSCTEISNDSYGNKLCVELEDEILRFFISNKNEENEELLDGIRYWYKESEMLGLPAFDRGVSLHLQGMRLKGGIKGLDVLIFIEGRGPLKTDELFLLKDLLKKYQDILVPGSSAYWKLVATWLFICLGIRGEQLRLLMDVDLLVKTNQDGKKIYILNVPSVKKTNALPRTFFKKRVIPSFIGEMLEVLIALNKEKSEKQHLNLESRPIFMSSSGMRLKSGKKREVQYMYCEATIGNAPKILLDKINRLEQRDKGTSFNIKLNPRRLRKTFATHAAAQGVPARVLAELLDHEDLQHVMVYYEQNVQFICKLDTVYKEQFGDIYAFFKGAITLEELVDLNKEQVIYGPANLRELVGIGFCGTDKHCSLAPPYSCYSCSKLQACDNKEIHKKILSYMIEEVSRLFKNNATPGKYDAKHILACKQLIKKLEA